MTRMRSPWYWYVPSVLLCLVAANQQRLVSTTALSPWAGGGFGMFSTAEMRGNRHLHAFALRPDIRRELAIPAGLHRQVQQVLAFPSEAALHALAMKLAEIPTPDSGPVAAIEIQIWATCFARETLQPSGVLLHIVEVAIDPRENRAAEG